MGLKLESKSETGSQSEAGSESCNDESGELDWFERLVKMSDLDREQLRELVEQKIDEYDGLVGRGAAAVLVGREQDVRLVEEVGEPAELSYIDLENVVCGMNDVNVRVTVLNVPPKSFVNSFEGGKVVNIKVSDGTGVTKLALWNEAVDSLFPRLESGMELKIRGGSTSSEEKNEYHFENQGFSVPQVNVGEDTKVIRV